MHTLIPHPLHPPTDRFEVTAQAARRGDDLSVHYTLTGSVEAILLPPIGAGHRIDGLWQTTCFEAFLRSATGQGYREFNVSPSGDWAAYAFTQYRESQTDLDCRLPVIWGMRSPDRLVLGVSLRIAPAALRLALSAVIEETDGTKSYWALAHPSDVPDFHHPDSFVLELPAI